MNITAEQARLYANGWQKVQAVVETIENTIEIAAKCGNKTCAVMVSKTITDEAVNLIREELKRAGFNSEFIRGESDCDTGFRVYWHEEKPFSFETEFAKVEKVPADDTHEMSVDAIATAFEHAMEQSVKDHTESKKTWQRGANTKDVISDEKLHDEYFKKGKSVNTIAGELGIKPWGLYKRVEEMKEQKLTQETECVSKRKTETPGI